MRKIYLIIIFLLFSFNVNAYGNKNMQKKEEKSLYTTSSFGLGGHGYFITGGTEDIGNGGGISVDFRTSFNKYLAFQTSFVYTYGEYSLYKNKTHLLNSKLMVIFQYETKRNETGFVPWAGVGLGVSGIVSNVLNNQGTVSGSGISFYTAAGLRYNFKKFFIGTYVDYTYTIYTSKSARTFAGSYNIYNNLDSSGIRVNGEIGLRF